MVLAGNSEGSDLFCEKGSGILACRARRRPSETRAGTAGSAQAARMVYGPVSRFLLRVRSFVDAIVHPDRVQGRSACRAGDVRGGHPFRAGRPLFQMRAGKNEQECPHRHCPLGERRASAELQPLLQAR